MLEEDYSTRLLCETLGVHRCNLDHEPRPDEDQPIQDAWRELAGAWPTYGYRRLTVMLHREGLPVNAKRVRRLRHELGICGEAPQRPPRTTESSPAYPRFPNRVEGREVTRPDPVGVADITYIRLRKEFI
jgi:transposase InsO family protein